MIKRQSNVVTFRLEAELRSLLDEAAQGRGVTVTDYLQELVEENLRPAVPDVFTQTAGIPGRMLDVERWFGLSVLESTKTLAPFGVETVLDLATPDKLLLGLEAELLRQFARTYEVNLQWLLTGQGAVYKVTHPGWYAAEVAAHIRQLWCSGELKSVKFIADRSEPSLTERTSVVVALEKVHPHPSLRGRHSVYESWISTHWNGGNAGLYELLRFCLSLFRKTTGLAFEVYPSGVTIASEAFEDLEYGRLHLAQALWRTRPYWNPELSYRELKEAKSLPESVRYDLDRAETWCDHDQLVAATLAGRREAEHRWFHQPIVDPA